MLFRSLERKLYDSAKKLLEDEISFALDKTTKEVEAMIHAKLEPLRLLHAKQAPNLTKAFVDNDDEDFIVADEEEEEEEDEDIPDDDSDE